MEAGRRLGARIPDIWLVGVRGEEAQPSPNGTSFRGGSRPRARGACTGPAAGIADVRVSVTLKVCVRAFWSRYATVGAQRGAPGRPRARVPTALARPGPQDEVGDSSMDTPSFSKSYRNARGVAVAAPFGGNEYFRPRPSESRKVPKFHFLPPRRRRERPAPASPAADSSRSGELRRARPRILLGILISRLLREF